MLEDLSPEELAILQHQLGEAENAVEALAEVLRTAYFCWDLSADLANLVEDVFEELRLDL